MQDTLFGGPDRIDGIVATLQSATWKTNGKPTRWRVDDRRDREYIQQLIDRLPGVDVGERIAQFVTWLAGQDFKEEVKQRGRLSTFICYPERHGSRSPRAATHRARSRGGTASVGGAPAPAAAFSGRSGYVSW